MIIDVDKMAQNECEQLQQVRASERTTKPNQVKQIIQTVVHKVKWEWK